MVMGHFRGLIIDRFPEALCLAVLVALGTLFLLFISSVSATRRCPVAKSLPVVSCHSPDHPPVAWKDQETERLEKEKAKIVT
jgi:hypothetical protein